MAKEQFERIVTVSPAYDKRNDPKGNYGIGSCRITFILKGNKGAMQFMIGTNWYVPSAREHLTHFPHPEQRKPDGWDVGYHSPRPMYKGQKPMQNNCHVLGGKCYYDGSGLMADEWVEDFIAGGTDWLWKKLEEKYHHQFSKPASRRKG